MGNFMNLGQKIEVKSMQKKRERGFLCLFKKKTKKLYTSSSSTRRQQKQN